MNPPGLTVRTPQQLSEEVQGQLAVLNNTEDLIELIVAGLALQLKAVDVQRSMLLDSACCPDTFRAECYPDPQAFRLGASLITLYALLGFQNQSVSLAEQACSAGETPDTVEPTLGSIIILIALIRFFRLLQAGQTGDAPSETPAQNELLNAPDF